MLIRVKMSEESCSLSVLADGYERKDKRATRLPRSYTHDLRRLEIRGSAAQEERKTEGVETNGAKESRNCQRLKPSTCAVVSEFKGKEQDLSNICDVVWSLGFCDCIE